ncbi:MAG: FtsX-like permease family protein, partial [Kitasatospora sp.]|nr:FtsX-like permease family protein [Kitasatospora sp.]
IVDSNGTFPHAFAAQHGAHLVATVDSAKATNVQLAATRRLPEVTAAAGPYPEVSVTPQASLQGGISLPTATFVGRSSPGGPLDDLTLDSGRWAQRPGEVVLSRDYAFATQLLGHRITMTGEPGRTTLTVVGIAKSITDSADGWVAPGEISALRPPHAAAAAQMLYRFRSAATNAEMRADVAALTTALPVGALAGAQSYLAIQNQQNRTISIIMPFVVAFGFLGLVMSVLIVANVVNGAVVSGYRRIGVLKSIGFTPAQVATAYIAQAGVPALAGCLIGVVAGNLLSLPLLSQTAHVYGVGKLLVPPWVDAAVPAMMCALVVVAALFPALRAGRLSAAAAIATGRAPRPGRGYAAHRLFGALPLPRPVTMGLAVPFARPSRTAVTLVAILFGATAVTFAAGLNSTLNKVANGQSHAASEQVQIGLPGGSGPGIVKAGRSPGRRTPPSPAALDRKVEAALRAQPGTLHFVGEAMPQVGVAGLTQPVSAEAFRGDASWTGYDMISGHWFRGPGQVVVNTSFLTVSGKAVGDAVTVTVGGRAIPVRIVGEAFDPQGQSPVLLTSWSTLGGSRAGLTVTQYDVGLRPGTSPPAYLATLGPALHGLPVGVSLPGSDPFIGTLEAMIATLTLLLALVAGLGVLNTVLLSTRDRVHDLGVLKAVGMTPRQTIATVVCWVVGAGLAAGIIAIPAGIILHATIVRKMADAAGTGLPASYVNVFGAGELALLAVSGLVIAMAGALLPASWAARSRTVSALHAE